MKHSYPQFFKAATGNSPYNWQIRLAEDPECRSRLIDIPTGLGKTAGVILAWLWNRFNESDADIPVCNPWPRRLVYCLPMRTLVEQTRDEALRWVENLVNQADALDLDNNARVQLAWLRKHSPIVLMGGEDSTPEKRDWDLHPEDPAILIGTQDMLLSRALNRGYGMSRYRWPMHFALLNNDALWIMDEVQLMGVGVETSAQLEGLRTRFGFARKTATWWMSATLAADRLETADFSAESLSENMLQISPDEAHQPTVTKRLHAEKNVEFTGLCLNSGKADDTDAYLAPLADQIIAAHEPDTLTLVILNRVDRAQNLFNRLSKTQPDYPLGLIHSRFRPEDRKAQMRLLHDPNGGIVVSTQAIEAGVDVSARHLFTELAPWSSLVQRFGRCNRDGKQPEGGRIHWMDLRSADAKQQEALALPYTPAELDRARATMEKLANASPAALKSIHVPEEPVIRSILRGKDILDLFDTTADVAGHDLDVSPYIRDGDDTDVEVFWREIPEKESPPSDTPQPRREEICRVSVHAFRRFLDPKKTKGRVWRWQPLTNEWEVVRSVVPGMTFLMASDLGGYTSDLGWTGDRKLPVPVLPAEDSGKPESDEDNRASFRRRKETLNEHTRKVVQMAESIAKELLDDSDWLNSLVTAARWHDVGKVHEHFQKMLAPDDIPPADGEHYLAKSDGNGRCERRHFRHELASALAWLDAPQSVETDKRDLIAYLIAAHHGKVRLSIRAMPTEHGPQNEPARIFARGVWDGETLPFENWPPIHLDGKPLPPLRMNLSILALGRSDAGEESWLERTLRLRDDEKLGPFRLGFLETLLRCADGRASSQA